MFLFLKKIYFSFKIKFLGCRTCRENMEELMLKLIAHEIRNPIALIGGLANRLHTRYTNEGQERFINDNDITKLKTIKKESDRICGITLIFDELIKNPVFNPKKANIDDIISNIIKIESHDAIQFHRHSLHKIQPLIDSARLSFALLNIVRNARDAVMERKEKCNKEAKIYNGEITICTETDADKNIFRIEIKNNGAPISKETMNEIFKPYFSTKGEKRGFGLTIAKDIIERHKGAINVKSAPEETIFEILLPIKTSGRNRQRGNTDLTPAFT